MFIGQLGSNDLKMVFVKHAVEYLYTNKSSNSIILGRWEIDGR